MNRLLRLFFSLVLLAAVVHSAAAQTLILLHTFHHRDVSSAVFSPDGKILATSGEAAAHAPRQPRRLEYRGHRLFAR